MKPKGLLPSDFYHFVVRQSTEEDGKLRLVWTVDAGPEEYLWQNVVHTYDTTSDFDMNKLERQMDRLNFKPYPPTHDEFGECFLGLRCKGLAMRKKEGNYLVNFIAEFKLPETPPMIDPLSPKDNSHFYHTQGRNLPI